MFSKTELFFHQFFVLYQIRWTIIIVINNFCMHRKILESSVACDIPLFYIIQGNRTVISLKNKKILQI